ncbi:MAG: DUF2157 domain-containing protein [Crenarchaeota archaeon]|nr:DUF2157 domain-containing protein [Thermoproteota archaeon]
MKLSLNKKEGKIVSQVIHHWNNEGLIDDTTKKKLNDSIEVRSFDWKKLAKYSFWFAIACFIIAVSSIITDNAFLRMLGVLFTSSDIAICLFFSGIAAGLYYLSFQRKQKYPNKTFSNEFILFLAVFSTAVSIIFLGRSLKLNTDNFYNLILFATIFYGLIGLFFPSNLVWVFSMLSLGTWFGAVTGYVSGWGAYFIGMNFPLRFVFMGLALIVLSFTLFKMDRFKVVQKSTYVFGLLYFFIALWFLSIFGNYGDVDKWMKVSQLSLIGWGFLFGFFAFVAILFGLKYDDHTSRSFGITFLFINLYTKFFEYFWDHIHKALFFMILAFTFWLIGKNAEKIWNLEFLTKNTSSKIPKKPF